MCASAKYWLRVLSEIKNRGVRDVCMLVCDGLKGLPDAVSAVRYRHPGGPGIEASSACR
jgi:transposase-like protein